MAGSDIGKAAVVVWEELRGSASVIVAASYQASGTWSSPTLLSDENAIAHQPLVVMDDFGRAVVVWEQQSGNGTGIWGTRLDPGQAPAQSQQLSREFPTPPSSKTIYLEPCGRGQVLWFEYTDAETKAFRLGGTVLSVDSPDWKKADLPLYWNEGDPAMLENLVAGVDASNRVVVAWTGSELFVLTCM